MPHISCIIFHRHVKGVRPFSTHNNHATVYFQWKVRSQVPFHHMPSIFGPLWLLKKHMPFMKSTCNINFNLVNALQMKFINRNYTESQLVWGFLCCRSGVWKSLNACFCMTSHKTIWLIMMSMFACLTSNIPVAWLIPSVKQHHHCFLICFSMLAWVEQNLLKQALFMDV